MGSSDIVPLVALALSVVLSAMASLARASLAMADLRAAAEEAGRGHLAAQLLLHVSRRGGRVALALLLARLGLNGAAVGALVYYMGRGGQLQAWQALWPLLGLLAVQVVLPYLMHWVATRYHEALARWSAPPALVLSMLFSPVTRPLEPIVPRLRRTAGDVGPPEGTLSSLSAGILIPMEEPVNPPDEREMGMIRAILRMEETTARDVMVPRPDVVGIDISESLGGAATTIVEEGHSRVVVYDGTIDRVVGVLYARDLLRVFDHQGPAPSLRDLVRPPLFVPESKRLDDLLREFQRARVHVAVVVDEYGGTAGLVTLEDLLEEIVGEIVDEFNRGEPEVQVVSESEVVIDARVHLDFLREHFSVEVEAEGFDTVGGLVYARLGKIPDPGDEVTADGLTVQVLSTSGRRIQKVRVRRTPPQEAHAGLR